MQVLYEEDGTFKVGSVVAEAPASFQVQTAHGRRAKVKATHVLMSFEQSEGGDLLDEARAYADTLETDFLWQCCGSGEFTFESLARDYVGRDPTPVESTGVLLHLHGAPMYFYRRGRGRFQAAPQETLQRALASAEKKKRVQEQIAQWIDALGANHCPPEIAALKDELLYAPDRNKPETRAFEQACERANLSAARLLERCGLLEDSHSYHLNGFLHEFHPQGLSFPAYAPPTERDDLPLAPTAAFSLDDWGTTEIDDAFSVAQAGPQELRVGIHIAAPSLGIEPGSDLDAIARDRLSTVYLPGAKVTMLPDPVIGRYSLDAGTERPVLSLYLTVALPAFSIRARHTRIERVRVAANLRHAELEALNAGFEAGTPSGLAFETELRQLWQLSEHLQSARGKTPAAVEGVDYSFTVENDRVTITPRQRGAPLDKLVSELMILTNATWGEYLAERDVAAIYRVQSSGKVRMSVHSGPHEGLGISCYSWMTSPLRRYIDLVNQWQLVATLSGARVPFARNSEKLMTAIRAFEIANARYDEHQRTMETYWCLRYILQERITEASGRVIRDNLVRLDTLPLTVRVAGMPEIESGERLRVELGEVDLIEATVACRFREAMIAVPDAAA